MSRHVFDALFGFNRLSRYLILKGICVTIWLRQTQKRGMDVVAGSTRFPDLSHPYIFLWDTMKSLAYDTPVSSEMNLMAYFFFAFATILETTGPPMSTNKCRVCVFACMHANGGNFENLL